MKSYEENYLNNFNNRFKYALLVAIVALLIYFIDKIVKDL